MRKGIQRETSSTIRVKISTAIQRQVYLAIQRKWTNDKKIIGVLHVVHKGKEEMEYRHARENKQGTPGGWKR